MAHQGAGIDAAVGGALREAHGAQAPLPSSLTGKPQPPTEKRVPSERSTSPMLPVPAATMAPGLPPCAPSSIVKESVSATRCAKPTLRATNSSRQGRLLTPDRPAPSAQRCHGGTGTPAASKALRTAS
jgi:hypothetical protein